MPTDTLPQPCAQYSDGPEVTDWVLALRQSNWHKTAGPSTPLIDELTNRGIEVYRVEKVAHTKSKLTQREPESAVGYAAVSRAAGTAGHEGTVSREFFLRLSSPEKSKPLDLEVRFTRKEFDLMHGEDAAGRQIRLYLANSGQGQLLVMT